VHSAEPATFYGRSELVSHIWERLSPQPGGDRTPPIILLFGPRGIGKTAVLDHLAYRCAGQAAQPFAPRLDLEDLGSRPAWHALAELAFELSETHWPQFGRLRFPRFTLGVMVAFGEISDDNPEEAERKALELLRRGRSQESDSQLVSDLVGHLPTLFGLPAVLELAPKLGHFLISRKSVVKRTFRIGLQFYREALTTSQNSVMTPLIRLSKMVQNRDSTKLERVLVQAFLADMRENYERGFRPRHCLVLLDNVHTPAGQQLINALSHGKLNQPGPDPLLVVATSRHLDLSIPDLNTQFDGTDLVTLWDSLPTDRESDRSSSPAAHPTSVITPVRLTPFSECDIARMDAERFGTDVPGFVFALTEGHPWAAIRVLDACARLMSSDATLSEAVLRGILDRVTGGNQLTLAQESAHYLLLDDVSTTADLHDLHGWMLSRDVVTAEHAFPATAGLQTKMSSRCWLESRNDPTKVPRVVLNPWLRRVLLHTSPAPDTIQRNARVLREHCQRSGLDPLETIYYDLVRGDAKPAVDYLNALFATVAAETWIAHFQSITDAPHIAPSDTDPFDAHADLVRGVQAEASRRALPDDDGHGERLITITGMVIAEWIRRDPLRDPRSKLNGAVALAYQDLGRRSPSGQLRFAAEANRYQHIRLG
jgi:hypothetical protein